MQEAGDEDEQARYTRQLLQSLANNHEMKKLASDHGLQICTIAWEDTARNKNSCFGPNIADMTLAVDNSVLMPMIRLPNFTDITADLAAKDFFVRVGNESSKAGMQQSRISLESYLQNIKQYLSADDRGTVAAGTSLFLERDKTILASAQYCVVPEAQNFAPNIFSYQSNSSHPAVLVVLVSQAGTSAQVVTERNQKLYFHKDGRAFDFNAKRLSTDRQERKVELKGAMTSDEQERNALLIFQIPLKIPRQRARKYLMGGTGGGGKSFLKSKKIVQQLQAQIDNDDVNSEEDEMEESCLESSVCLFDSNSSGVTLERKVKKRAKGIEDAVLTLGKDHGAFGGLRGLVLERDGDYPIRVTIQCYQASDTEVINAAVFEHMSQQIKTIYATGKATGSLVVDLSSRDTAPTLTADIAKTTELTQMALKAAQQQQEDHVMFAAFASSKNQTPNT